MIKASFIWRGARRCRTGQNRYAAVSVTVERTNPDGYREDAIRIVAIKSDRPEETGAIRQALQDDKHFLDFASMALWAFERTLTPLLKGQANEQGKPH